MASGSARYPFSHAPTRTHARAPTHTHIIILRGLLPSYLLQLSNMLLLKSHILHTYTLPRASLMLWDNEPVTKKMPHSHIVCPPHYTPRFGGIHHETEILPGTSAFQSTTSTTENWVRIQNPSLLQVAYTQIKLTLNEKKKKKTRPHSHLL